MAILLVACSSEPTNTCALSSPQPDYSNWKDGAIRPTVVPEGQTTSRQDQAFTYGMPLDNSVQRGKPVDGEAALERCADLYAKEEHRRQIRLGLVWTQGESRTLDLPQPFPTRSSTGKGPNWIGYDGKAALHRAAESNDLSRTQELLDAGADPNLKIARSVNTYGRNRTSNRRNRLYALRRRIYERIANIRRNAHRQAASAIVKTADIVCVETLTDRVRRLPAAPIISDDY